MLRHHINSSFQPPSHSSGIPAYDRGLLPDEDQIHLHHSHGSAVRECRTKVHCRGNGISVQVVDGSNHIRSATTSIQEGDDLDLDDDDYDDDPLQLVANGQIEFVLGGWTMEDEACTTYSANIDQMTEGHQFIVSTFGLDAMPKFAMMMTMMMKIDD